MDDAIAQNSGAAHPPRISVVVELGTRTVTDRIATRDAVARQLESVDGVGASEVEFIFVGHDALPEDLLRLNCRSVRSADIGYYGWKNCGAALSSGEYLVFWDSDCRPACGYLRQVRSRFDADPELAGLAGPTVYDGSSFLTRLNTVLSFGYLFAPGERLQRPALSHNVALRRAMVPPAPFGPFTGRSGGDTYLFQWFGSNGARFALDPLLLIYHEDPSYSLPALLERHLRELFVALARISKRSRSRKLFIAWRSLLRVRRMRRVLRYGHYHGLSHLEVALSVPILTLYWLLDAAALLVLTFAPSLLSRWLRYQFGVSLDTLPIDAILKH